MKAIAIIITFFASTAVWAAQVPEGDYRVGKWESTKESYQRNFGMPPEPVSLTIEAVEGGNNFTYTYPKNNNQVVVYRMRDGENKSDKSYYDATIYLESGDSWATTGYCNKEVCTTTTTIPGGFRVVQMRFFINDRHYRKTGHTIDSQGEIIAYWEFDMKRVD